MADPTREIPPTDDPLDDDSSDCADEGIGVLQFLAEIFGLRVTRDPAAATPPPDEPAPGIQTSPS